MAFLQTLPTSTRLIAQYLAIFLDSALLHCSKDMLRSLGTCKQVDDRPLKSSMKNVLAKNCFFFVKDVTHS